MCYHVFKGIHMWCECGDSHSIGNVGRPTEEGVVSFRTTSADGEGGSEILDFSRTSFMNVPYQCEKEVKRFLFTFLTFYFSTHSFYIFVPT